MLNHIGQSEIAERIQNAWLKTLEDGIHTYDLFKEGVSSKQVSTSDFAQAVMERLGQKPQTLKAVEYKADVQLNLPAYVRKAPMSKELLGVDVFVHWAGTAADDLAVQVQQLNQGDLKLKMITNRGIKVWPDGFPETFCTDHWRCRFQNLNGAPIMKHQIISLLQKAEEISLDVVKTENLYAFDGKPAFSLGQGQ